MRLPVLIFTFFLTVYSYCSIAQSKSEIHVEASAIHSSQDELMPLYQYSNIWGIISPFQESVLLFQLGGYHQLLDNEKIALKLGVSGIIKDNLDESLLHQAYIRGRVFNAIDFSIGKEAFSPISYNDTLTVGGFLNNSNARPIPKITIGIYEYLPLSFIKNWVEIRGGISHGWLNDDRTAEGKSNSARMPYLHEKWAYIRLGSSRFKPYAGLVHNSIYGGTRPNGKEIPIDYIATFFGMGSDKIGGGEATNAAGAHEGFWDIGLYASTSWSDLLIYLQRPFADGSGMKTWELRNKDFRLGCMLDLKGPRYLKSIALEFIRTEHQTGPGIPDPIYPEGHPKEGNLFFLDDIDDYDALMLEVFNETTSGWNKDDVMNYMVENQNHGFEYGGRDDYNNNGTYYNGWTYHKQSFGMPLYHSKHQTSIFAPSWATNNYVIFKNTRIKALHVGFQGEVIRGLEYLFKLTLTKNYGSYSEQYVRRYSWTEAQDYLYGSGKNQTYSHLLLTYQPAKLNKLKFKSSFSFDSGELYESFGVNIGLSYGIQRKSRKAIKSNESKN
ncbi:MAG: hypothetical protein MI975_27420 [Cytophagales bacterium]|nr:hypothetical protein [Cytophagales bacterium]